MLCDGQSEEKVCPIPRGGGGGTDRDQQGSRRFPACFQIVEAFANQVSAWVCLEIHDLRNHAAEQGERALVEAAAPRLLKTLTG
jgi:hypothetical protein